MFALAQPNFYLLGKTYFLIILFQPGRKPLAFTATLPYPRAISTHTKLCKLFSKGWMTGMLVL